MVKIVRRFVPETLQFKMAPNPRIRWRNKHLAHILSNRSIQYGVHNNNKIALLVTAFKGRYRKIQRVEWFDFRAFRCSTTTANRKSCFLLFRSHWFRENHVSWSRSETRPWRLFVSKAGRGGVRSSWSKSQRRSNANAHWSIKYTHKGRTFSSRSLKSGHKLVAKMAWFKIQTFCLSKPSSADWVAKSSVENVSSESDRSQRVFGKGFKEQARHDLTPRYGHSPEVWSVFVLGNNFSWALDSPNPSQCHENFLIIPTREHKGRVNNRWYRLLVSTPFSKSNGNRLCCERGWYWGNCRLHWSLLYLYGIQTSTDEGF